MRRKRTGTAIQFDLFKSLQPQPNWTTESPHSVNSNSDKQGERSAQGQSEIRRNSPVGSSTEEDSSHQLTPPQAEIDSRISVAISSVARLIDYYGDDYWPLLERLENELKMRQSRSSRLSRYLERR